MPQEKAKDHKLKAVPKFVASGAVQTDIDGDQCPLCFGTGMQIIANEGARICSCRRRKDDISEYQKVKLPKRYDGCHFHNYKPQNASQRAALNFASSFAMDFPATDRGLLLMGTVGVGKTHLAVSILKGLTERGFYCLFYEFGTLLKEIQDSYNPNTFTSELSVLSPVLSADVLVLDELGASKPTDWVRDTLGHIINSRYNEKKFTIFTTNYLDERKNDREETLEDRIGVRTRSRIFEMCRSVVISGDDHRRSLDSRTLR